MAVWTRQLPCGEALGAKLWWRGALLVVAGRIRGGTLPMQPLRTGRLCRLGPVLQCAMAGQLAGRCRGLRVLQR
jgi:hypothetical protein